MPMGTPVSQTKRKSTSSPRPPSPMSPLSFENSSESNSGSVGIEEQAHDQREFKVMSPEHVQKMAVIPHHLRSKAAGANSLKKGARVLAVGLFTVNERCSCTVSGSTNKSKDNTKRPQFEPHRMTLIHGKCFKMYHILCDFHFKVVQLAKMLRKRTLFDSQADNSNFSEESCK